MGQFNERSAAKVGVPAEESGMLMLSLYINSLCVGSERGGFRANTRDTRQLTLSQETAWMGHSPP
jgi:hypothetical protein